MGTGYTLVFFGSVYLICHTAYRPTGICLPAPRSFPAYTQPFLTDPPCDRRTDRQSDRQTELTGDTAIAYSMRAKHTL